MLLGASLFLLAALGLGLMLSTFSRTQQQAFALTFILLNPLYILSGFAYPIAAMPAVLRWFTLDQPVAVFPGGHSLRVAERCGTRCAVAATDRRWHCSDWAC